MTQRNPMNERYQNTDENKKMGKTRKSAASAKPVTKAASSVRIENKESARPQGRMAKAQRRAQVQSDERKRQKAANQRIYNPNDPEYRKWRRVWIALIVSALAFTSFSFFLTSQTSDKLPVYIFLGIGYAFLIAAVVVDVRKVRKARANAAVQHSKSKSKKAKARAAAAKKAEESSKEKEAVTDGGSQKKGLFGKKKTQE